jgi:hypothetical protein
MFLTFLYALCNEQTGAKASMVLQSKILLLQPVRYGFVLTVHVW